VEEFRSKLCLVDLAGSERAHDTGLTGVGLEEGIAINQSLSALGHLDDVEALIFGEVLAV
jgi:kinesin family protein 1